MQEIEAEFKIDNLELIRNKILTLDIKSTNAQNQTDTYFAHTKSKDLENTPTYLRIRTVNNKSKIAMHIKQEAYRWEELEFEIEDPIKLKQIFLNLGFKIDITVEKQRETFFLENAEILIDNVKHAGLFLEIEAQSKPILFDYCNLLGLEYGDKDPLEGKSYADLVREGFGDESDEK
jgi:predicted adenylyl cyclase CyaB